jgi:hypothetical protein
MSVDDLSSIDRLPEPILAAGAILAVSDFSCLSPSGDRERWYTESLSFSCRAEPCEKPKPTESSTWYKAALVEALKCYLD